MKKYLYLILIFLFTLNIFAVIAFYQQKPTQIPKIVFLDIGQGDAALIDAGDDLQILIDGGDGRDILDRLGEHLPFYDRKIELVVMTHPDKDHLGGLVEVLKYYEVGQILETGIKCNKAICEEWDKLIEEKNIPVKYAEFGQRIRTENMELAVLYPFENLEGKEIKNSNDASIVLRAVVGDSFRAGENSGEIDLEQEPWSKKAEVLFTGDAGYPVERELLNKNVNVKAKILKVSHHGSKHATSNAFLQAVNPEKAIISVGKNSYGHPAEELLNRLKNMSIEIFRTDEIGDWVLEY